MPSYKLQVTLESDAIFGRGDGLAGYVDIEVQYDEYGCPYFSGKTLKGILVEECADIINSFSALGEQWEESAHRLFGSPGNNKSDTILALGDLLLPAELVHAIRTEVDSGNLTADEILRSLTVIRQQTAMDDDGVPKEHSLRSSRVILNGSIFESDVIFMSAPSSTDIALFTACILALRHIGTQKTRGNGKVNCKILDYKTFITEQWESVLKQEVANGK